MEKKPLSIYLLIAVHSYGGLYFLYKRLRLSGAWLQYDLPSFSVQIIWSSMESVLSWVRQIRRL